jgi:hypothetical protein
MERARVARVRPQERHRQFRENVRENVRAQQ